MLVVLFECIEARAVLVGVVVVVAVDAGGTEASP